MAASPSYIMGIDVGSATCSFALIRPDKTPVSKPGTFANTATGFASLDAQLTSLGAAPAQILVGMEATGLYWEKLYYWLRARLSTPAAPPDPDPAVRRPTRPARQDRQAGRQLHCPLVVQ